MKFEEVIKIAGKEYIQEFLRQEHKEARLPIGFRIKMWWMFQCNKYKWFDNDLQLFTGCKLFLKQYIDKKSNSWQ